MKDFAEKMANEVHTNLTEDNKKSIIKESYHRCDWNTKAMIIMEELAELQQVISKLTRNDMSEDTNSDILINVIEEMADVSICLEFLKIKCNITDEELNKAIDIKLSRENERTMEYYDHILRQISNKILEENQ